MSDRIDRYLEGTSGKDTLTASERADAEAVERAIGAARALLSIRPTPDVTTSVMRQIEDIGPVPVEPRFSLAQRMGQALWRPWTLQLRPVYALAAAGALVAALALVPAEWRSMTPRIAEGGPAGGRVFVQFRLETEAAQVQLAGSFTNWEPRYNLRQMSPGVWTVSVPLGEGVHDYAFVVDGREWRPDPVAASIDDGFGGQNSRLTVLSPEIEL